MQVVLCSCVLLHFKKSISRGSLEKKTTTLQFTSPLVTCLPSFHEILYLCLLDRINICICSSRDPTARCGRSSLSLRNFSVYEKQSKTNMAFRSIDNARVAGWECCAFLLIQTNILGDSMLNVITGEMTVSHAQTGADDWLQGWFLIQWNSFCYTERSAKCISQNSKAQVWRGPYFKRRYTSVCCKTEQTWSLLQKYKFMNFPVTNY